MCTGSEVTGVVARADSQARMKQQQQHNLASFKLRSTLLQDALLNRKQEPKQHRAVAFACVFERKLYAART